MEKYSFEGKYKRNCDEIFMISRITHESCDANALKLLTACSESGYTGGMITNLHILNAEPMVMPMPHKKGRRRF